MARCTGSSGCSRGAMVSSRYSLIALDSNSDTESSTRSTGNFLCGEMARNQSGLLSRSMWRNSNGVFFSRSEIADRCTHGQVLKLTRRYSAMKSSSGFAPERGRLRGFNSPIALNTSGLRSLVRKTRTPRSEGLAV